jgi:hypothetical protein
MNKQIKFTVKPFTVPNSVEVETTDLKLSAYAPVPPPGSKSVFSFSNVALSTFEPVELDALCAQFRESVFKAAGKNFPVAEAIGKQEFGKAFENDMNYILGYLCGDLRKIYLGDDWEKEEKSIREHIQSKIVSWIGKNNS